ncbi:MAG: hypothetical protein BRD45_06960 [Bacteroidetes bacterium QS_8_64_10]|nr:MAG: hypothetical protein BRD45_06960 [Bacteroidetes bacterium QS_8_64_10]
MSIDRRGQIRSHLIAVIAVVLGVAALKASATGAAARCRAGLRERLRRVAGRMAAVGIVPQSNFQATRAYT